MATHDIQITPAGKLLVYSNFTGKVPGRCLIESQYKGVLNRLPRPANAPFFKLNFVNRNVNALNIPYKGLERNYSTLSEYDPYSGTILWNYQGDPLYSFNSDKFGGVTHLPDDHYLFSDYTKYSRAVEIDENEKIVWELRLDYSDQLKVKSVKPFYKIDFFKARGINIQ